ncbi:Lin0512 family protein [Listeria aquatica]|uniref:Lin0512 family protein n=1 Tax=Listeria aquatica TaxID=1494960 RepID=UPI003F6F580A
MEKLLFIQTGFGVDVHGQNVTKASKRAVENAIYHNSMPGIEDLLPNQDLNNMKVRIKLAVPADKDALDKEAVKELIPYGTVEVEVMDGGMITTSGIFLAEKDDKNEMMYIVNASVETGY